MKKIFSSVFVIMFMTGCAAGTISSNPRIKDKTMETLGTKDYETYVCKVKRDTHKTEWKAIAKHEYYKCQSNIFVTDTKCTKINKCE